jgi:hypothetical protein
MACGTLYIRHGTWLVAGAGLDGLLPEFGREASAVAWGGVDGKVVAV